MQIQEAVEVCVTQKYADFEGVAARSELWFFYLFLVIMSALLQAFVPTVMDVFDIAMAVPTLAVGARRLHDTNRSGWWQLLWFVPLVGWISLMILFAQPGKSPATPIAPAAPTSPT